MRYYLVLFCTLLFLFKSAAAVSCPAFETCTLTEQELHNLSALSKTYGYVRYFYPNPQESRIDWLRFLEYAIPQIKGSSSNEELRTHLTSLFGPLIPQIGFSSSPRIPGPVGPEIIGTMYVRENKSFPFPCREMTFGEIVKRPYREGLPVPDQPYSFQLSFNLYVHFPVAVTRLPQENKELTRIVKAAGKKKWRKMSYFTDPVYRIANAMISNNLVTHFYPYWEEDELDKDWDARCREHLKAVAGCVDYPAYIQSAYAHLARLRDSHIMVRNGIEYSALFGRYQPYYVPNDFSVCVLEDRLFIENSRRNDLKGGDEIQAVNSVPVPDFIARKIQEIPASHKKAAYVQLCHEMAFKTYSKDSVIHLRVRNSLGEESGVTIQPQNNGSGNFFPETEFIRELENGIYKVNLYAPSCNYTTFASFLP